MVMLWLRFIDSYSLLTPPDIGEKLGLSVMGKTPVIKEGRKIPVEYRNGVGYILEGQPEGCEGGQLLTLYCEKDIDKCYLGRDWLNQIGVDVGEDGYYCKKKFLMPSLMVPKGKKQCISIIVMSWLSIPGFLLTFPDVPKGGSGT
eukprot:TRINITY_DN10426_c0_g1_i1.p3 TRINITY_DN10426_c0_g1~~TRINITY_DN10426_c0_g1_i1.p3  ORF type:complete len:145 (-),score=8.71 TRINITY_DN10426_c0_g1_i1:21-455(-)